MAMGVILATSATRRMVTASLPSSSRMRRAAMAMLCMVDSRFKYTVYTSNSRNGNCLEPVVADGQRVWHRVACGDAMRTALHTIQAASTNHQKRIIMDQAQLIQAAASIAGGMAVAHYDKFSGLVATRITDIAETAVKIARAIDAEARKQQ